MGVSRSLAHAAGALLVLVSLGAPRLHAAEHVTLANGFDMICDHRQAVGAVTRLYVGAGEANFVEVNTADIASIDSAVPIPAPAPEKAISTAPAKQEVSASELRELLTAAGAQRNLDVDLLACIVRAESGGHVHAVSRTGAQGLMQLMPGTAAQLGVSDSFVANQNVTGGTTYLNSLLLRYHDNLALALAAYNAGPNAVDRYHGVPPYRETRAYVARIIHEFNQRKDAEQAAARRSDRAAKALHASSSTSSTAVQSD